MPLYFDASQLPKAVPEYVVWIDIMGTQVSMSRSISITANFIFKLHTAALQAPNQNVSMYPVMDGLYATSDKKADILNFVRSIFENAADEFISAAMPQHRFIIRGALAYGPVIHGANVPQAASTTLHNNQTYKNSVLLGLPMVQAHLGERKAPPFGIYVHESARSFAPARTQPLHFPWWKWETAANRNTWTTLNNKLGTHLDWCAQRAIVLEYANERIEIHKEMMTQYFL